MPLLPVSCRRLISVSGAARLLRVPSRTVRHLLKAGQLAGFRNPYHWAILRSDLEQFVSDACARHGVTVYALTPTALLTVDAVAEALGRSARTIRLEAQRQHMPAFKIGRTWRFWREDINQLSRRQQQAGADGEGSRVIGD